MINGEKIVERPIRWVLIGGGRGSQIGYIHRSAALRDSNFELVAGAFDINPERGKDFGKNLHVDPDRCYTDYKELIAAEELEQLVKSSGKVMFISYGYSGHQMIEQARQMVANGDLGKIRVINMQFAHGAHNVAVEKKSGSTAWRVDPKKAGPAYVLGDVGTHMVYLAEAILPELKIKRLMCTRQSFVEGRQLEDNALTVMEYDTGSVAYIWSSCVNAGSEFGFRFRIVGEKASITWDAEHPNQLGYEVQGNPQSVMQRGAGYLYESARADDRIGGGHPEGLFEAWSNLYTEFARAIDLTERGEQINF